jgi:hypothetical protein
MLYIVKVPNAGDVESSAKSRLSLFAVSRPYIKNGSPQMATELFKCSFSRAKKALMASIDSTGNAALSDPWKNRFTGLFEFDSD